MKYTAEKSKLNPYIYFVLSEDKDAVAGPFTDFNQASFIASKMTSGDIDSEPVYKKCDKCNHELDTHSGKCIDCWLKQAKIFAA